jgi:hypothetical protein
MLQISIFKTLHDNLDHVEFHVLLPDVMRSRTRLMLNSVAQWRATQDFEYPVCTSPDLLAIYLLPSGGSQGRILCESKVSLCGEDKEDAGDSTGPLNNAFTRPPGRVLRTPTNCEGVGPPRDRSVSA